MTTLLNQHTSKVVHSSNILVIQVLYVQEPQEQLQIMLQLVNIDLGFFPGKTSAICVGYTLLKLDNTSYISTGGIINIEIQEETQLATLLCFLFLTLMCLLFQTLLFNQL